MNPPLRFPTFLPCKFPALLIAFVLIAYWVIASRGEFVFVAGDFENSVATDLVPERLKIRIVNGGKFELDRFFHFEGLDEPAAGFFEQSHLRGVTGEVVTDDGVLRKFVHDAEEHTPGFD